MDTPGPLAYVAYRYVDGIPLSKANRGRSLDIGHVISQEILSELSIINSVSMDGFGEPVDGYHASSGTWIDFVRDSLLAGYDASTKSGQLPESLIQRVPGIAADLDRHLRVERPRLVWVDISPDNIIVGKDGHLVGLVDFEGCLSGDPMATLGYAYARYGDSDNYKSLLRAWGSPRSANEPADPYRIYLYAILRVMRIAAYAHETLPTGAAVTPLTEYFPGFLNALDAIGIG